MHAPENERDAFRRPVVIEFRSRLVTVLELKLERVVRLHVLSAELSRQIPVVLEDALRALRHCGPACEGAPSERERTVRRAEVLLAPALIEQVEEIENVELHRELLPAVLRQILLDRHIDDLRPRRPTRVALHDPATLLAKARGILNQRLERILLLRDREGSAGGH